jgi:hypothetical protein
MGFPPQAASERRCTIYRRRAERRGFILQVITFWESGFRMISHRFRQAHRLDPKKSVGFPESVGSHHDLRFPSWSVGVVECWISNSPSLHDSNCPFHHLW